MSALSETPAPQSLAHASALAAACARVAQFFMGSLERLAIWHDRAAQRRALAGLDTRMLKDIGLTGADVEREIAKPFWRP